MHMIPMLKKTKQKNKTKLAIPYDTPVVCPNVVWTRHSPSYQRNTKIKDVPLICQQKCNWTSTAGVQSMRSRAGVTSNPICILPSVFRQFQLLHLTSLNISNQSKKIPKSQVSTNAWPTYLPTDGQTDGRTDGRTHTPSYRDARTHLQMTVYVVS